MRAGSGKSRLVLSWAVLLAGCAAPAPVELDLTGAVPTTDTSELARVLQAVVTDGGRFDPAALKRMEGTLDACLRKLAVTGPRATPELFPTYGSRWAYWYNARAAWSMKLALLAGCPPRSKPGQLWRRRFPLDGRWMSLEEIDRLLLAEARRTGEFRLAACAPGVTVSFQALPERPLTPADLPRALARAFDRLVLDERRFVLDVERRRVLVPPMLWACREMLVRRYQADYGVREVTLLTALRPHVGPAALRRLEEAVGYAVTNRGRLAILAIPGPKRFYPGKLGRIERPAADSGPG